MARFDRKRQAFDRGRRHLLLQRDLSDIQARIVARVKGVPVAVEDERLRVEFSAGREGAVAIRPADSRPPPARDFKSTRIVHHRAQRAGS